MHEHARKTILHARKSVPASIELVELWRSSKDQMSIAIY